ncbi:hypothetical protein Slala05_75660 [Streptomyces lavendulae subsp. lavendulae]|nr:hypothetical protein Slala05_75660 [Streptomyces lavendulae subsp. lavendulae]
MASQRRARPGEDSDTRRVGVPEHAGLARAEKVKGVCEFGGTPGVWSPGGGDDCSARSGGCVLGEDSAGGERFIVWVCEYGQQGRQRGACHG